MSDDMVLVDLHGIRHPLSKWNISWMLGAGWIFFLASQVLNYLYYKIHPSSVDFRLKTLHNNTLLKWVKKEINGNTRNEATHSLLLEDIEK